MRKEIEIYELIEQYLNNQLSANEISDIKTRIESDPGFASEVEKHRKIHDFIYESSLIQISDKLEEIHNKYKDGNRFFKGWKWLFIIMPLLLTTGILLLTQKKNIIQTVYLEKPVVNSPVTNQEIQKNTLQTKEINHTTHPQSQVQYKKASVNSQTEPVKQQEIINNPAAFYPKSDSNLKSNPVKPVDTRINPIIVQLPHESIPDDNTVFNPELIKKDDADDCENIVIIAEITTENSCSEKPTGKIIVISESVTGGIPPYEVSVDDMQNFNTNLILCDLYSGNYEVFIRDKNLCESSLGVVNIDSKDCAYEFVFAPDKGEVWKIPSFDIPYTVKIYSKNGKMVFTETIDYEGDYEWNGRSLTGEELPMGAYMFLLESNDKTPFYGSVTIVR